MDSTDAVRLVRELGPVWGPPVVFLGLIISLVRYRWKYKGARGLALIWDRSFLATFLVGVVILACYFYYRYRWWGLPPPFEKGEIGILIGELPGDRDRQQQAAYAREIYALIQKSPELQAIVKVKMLERPLPADPQEQHAKALIWGRWLRATFVLRPNVVEGVQEPWVTVVDQPWFTKLEAPMDKFPSAQLANLDQLRLPSNLLLLARCAQALAFSRQGSFDHVAAELRDVLAAPDLPELAPSRSSLSNIYSAALIVLGKNDEAAAQLKKAITLKPDDADAHNNLGVTYLNKQDLDGAIAEFREALRLKPDTVAHCNLGLALYGKGDFDGAIAEYREALRLNPAFAPAHYNLGNSLAFFKHDLNGAIAEYRASLRSDPGHAETHYNLGAALSVKGDFDGGIAEFREALRLNPGYAEAHSNLGFALNEKHDVDGAIAEYREALRLNPGFAAAHNNLGSAYRDKHDVDGAIAEFREALRLEPNLTKTQVNLRSALLEKANKLKAPGKVQDGVRP